MEGGAAMAKFRYIEKYISNGNYEVSVMLSYMEQYINRMIEEYNLEIEPDFQRGHVWNEEKQIMFVEYLLRGGGGVSNTLRFNCPGWMGSFKGPLQLVDGLQRVTACLRFLRNEIPAPLLCGHYYDEYEDHHELNGVILTVQINDLPTRAEVLQWYLQINSGGVVHTEKELRKVRFLLEKEKESEL